MRGLDGRRALGWRLARQGLGERLDATAAEVVESVIALRGWPAAQSELAVAVRQARPEPAAVARALDAGELIRGYAFRGGSYVFTHRAAADPDRRPVATRGANLILNAGVVSGSWRVRRGVLETTWFTEAGPVPGPELADERERLAGIRGEELELVVETG
ncbi:hypothetical protein [Enemella evansiae]|uniref:hypothetical protein n=1 Tax=Enemella evansiae TaxID=2016499 RepID=UPI000B973FA0|nr:hypothetical protein [Enemella evansiae]OYO01398.1 hypothetical protein CGZ97_18495 [Enemella evansiae]